MMKESAVILGILFGGMFLVFGIQLLMTHAVIWTALELFNVDWRSKFWVVFVGLCVILAIFSWGKSK